MLYRFEDNRILPKNMRLKMKSTKTKNYAKKSFLMVYGGTYDCYENIKIKL